MGREVRSDGRADGEAYRECDANEHECGGAAALGRDIGEDGAEDVLDGAHKLEEARLHRELDVSFADSACGSGEHERCEGRGLDPPERGQCRPEGMVRRWTHTMADRMFPIMLTSKTRFLPYLSDRLPI